MNSPSLHVLLILVLGFTFGLAGGLFVSEARHGGCESPKISEVRAAATRITCNALKMAALTYEMQTGVFPCENHGVKDLILNPGVTNWRGPYLKDDNVLFESCVLDGWGRPIRYAIVDNYPVFTSFGPDGIFGNDDDIPKKTTPNKTLHGIVANSSNP